MKRKMVTYFWCTVMLLLSTSVFTHEKKPPEPKPAGPPPPGLPIDGGISLLLIAGAVYGVYAIKKNKKSLIND